MSKTRIFFLAVILLAGIGLVTLLVVNKARPPLDSSLAPVFQLLGKPVKSLDRALTRVMPIDGLDEKAFGDAIALRYAYLDGVNVREREYLNEMIGSLAEFAHKPFKYRVFVLDYPYPNAFALPGGMILVTMGLLDVMENEGQVAAILAHEMGHIERSHCLDAVRFQLLSRKIGSRQLGEIADLAVNILLKHSFSKTQEDEADEYAYELILNTPYDPCSVAGSFNSFLKYGGAGGSRENKAHIIRDYFMTHPPMQLRAAKFAEKAGAWWADHPGERRYLGFTNLKTRTCFLRNNREPSEWRKEGN